MYGSLGLLWTPVIGRLTPFTSKDSATECCFQACHIYYSARCYFMASNHKQYLSTQKTIGVFGGSRILLGHRKLLSSSKISTYWRAGLSSTTSAILTDDNSTMTTSEDDTENIGLLGTDPGLEPFIDHFRHRVKRYVDQKKLIEKYEGSLEEFALGYLKFGFNREEGGIVYREWAPAAQEAQVIGDFNEWNGLNHVMQKNEFGVWSIKIPDSGGNPAIPHNSRVKFRFKHGDGVWVDRIPAWIKYATVDPAKFAAPYDGVYWDPPPSERC